jgi:hypothetical protein
MYTSQAYPQYVSSKELPHATDIGLHSKLSIDRYPISEVPRELQRLIRDIGAHFGELKDMLAFNPTTGFYTYEIINNGVSILLSVVCKHEYLTYTGASMIDISRECYRDGKCKYCGAELNAYHERPIEV